MVTAPSSQAGAVVTEHRRPQMPPQPNTIEETGLSFLFLVELLAKTLFLRGQ